MMLRMVMLVITFVIRLKNCDTRKGVSACAEHCFQFDLHIDDHGNFKMMIS